MSATGPGAAAAAPVTARPMRADARRNCEKLLAEAAAAFAERGSDDVSLEEIARRAGVGIGTLYRHFPTRQALLESVYRDQVELLARRADDLMAADSPADALADWLGAMVAWGATKRSMSATLLATIGRESELISTCSLMLRQSIEKLLRRAQEAGAARDDVQPADVLRLVHGLVVACDQAPGDPAQIRRMLALVMDGLRPQPGGA